MGTVFSARAVVGEFFRVAVTPTSIGTLNGNITASATTITITVGATSLEAGVWAVTIDSEVIPVTQSGVTLTVETNGRGYFGTTAAAHTSGATVSRANLNAIVGNNVYDSRLPEGFIDDPIAPAIVYTGLPGTVVALHGSTGRSGIHSPRESIRCYGGKDDQGNFPEVAADLVWRALAERIEEVTSAEAVTSGVVMSIPDYTEGQPLIDPDYKPEWPYVLTFVDFRLRSAT